MPCCFFIVTILPVFAGDAAAPPPADDDAVLNVARISTPSLAKQRLSPQVARLFQPPLKRRAAHALRKPLSRAGGRSRGLFYVLMLLPRRHHAPRYSKRRAVASMQQQARMRRIMLKRWRGSTRPRGVSWRMSAPIPRPRRRCHASATDTESLWQAAHQKSEIANPQRRDGGAAKRQKTQTDADARWRESARRGAMARTSLRSDVLPSARFISHAGEDSRAPSAVMPARMAARVAVVEEMPITLIQFPQ